MLTQWGEAEREGKEELGAGRQHNQDGKGETAINSKVPKQIQVCGKTKLLQFDNAATSWHILEIHEEISPVSVIQ